MSNISNISNMSNISRTNKLWSKFGDQFLMITEDQRKVLEDPQTLGNIAPGYRRKMAVKMAAMSPIERSQLLEFSLKFRGRHLAITLAKIMLVLTLCGLAVALLFPQRGLVESIAYANVMGLVLVAWMVTTYFKLSQLYGKTMHLVMLNVFGYMLGHVIGLILGGWGTGWTFQESIEKKWMEIVISGCVIGLFLSVPAALMGAIRHRHYKQYTAKLERDAQEHRAARELSESRLRLLHAQIVPHFLFNTLGAVQQLAEKGAPEAARLTAILIAFLRASMAEMRSETVSLNADFALIKAYLDVMKARLGTRLDYTLDLPDSLAHVTMPSMMLLTLVENAIKHGIEPSLRGGHIKVTGSMQDACVALTVSDTGPGLGSKPGAGEGLANVRARLTLLYGAAGTLSVADGAEDGVVATIMLPLTKESQ